MSDASTNFRASNAEMVPGWEVRYAAADPLVDIVDALDPVIDLLRVVFLALGNPEKDDFFQSDHCRHVLNVASERVVEVRDMATASIKEIREERAQA